MALEVVALCIFLLNGITIWHYLLIIFGVIFGIGHILSKIYNYQKFR